MQQQDKPTVEQRIAEGHHVMKMREMPARVYWGRRILHLFIGHLPVYQHTEHKLSGPIHHYKCYWCDEQLERGMWGFLYDRAGRANQ